MRVTQRIQCNTIIVCDLKTVFRRFDDGTIDIDHILAAFVIES